MRGQAPAVGAPGLLRSGSGCEASVETRLGAAGREPGSGSAPPPPAARRGAAGSSGAAAGLPSWAGEEQRGGRALSPPPAARGQRGHAGQVRAAGSAPGSAAGGWGSPQCRHLPAAAAAAWAGGTCSKAAKPSRASAEPRPP